MLVDREIKDLIDDGILQDADEGRIGPISYDLRNLAFYGSGESLDKVALNPGDSVFVGAVESILLTGELTAQVALKNSRCLRRRVRL